MGMLGARLRTALATRCVKSGLSMITSMSGFAATTASAVIRMRLRMAGSRAITATMPMTAISSRGKREFSPSCLMACPPTPPKRRRSAPSRAFRERISLAPSWSPDSSPDTIQTVNGLFSAKRLLHPGQIDGDEEQAEAIGRSQGLFLLQHEGGSRSDGDAGKACLGGLCHGSRADGRHVDPQILTALGGLDQHSAFLAAAKAEPGLAKASYPTDHAVGALWPLDS